MKHKFEKCYITEKDLGDEFYPVSRTNNEKAGQELDQKEAIRLFLEGNKHMVYKKRGRVYMIDPDRMVDRWNEPKPFLPQKHTITNALTTFNKLGDTEMLEAAQGISAGACEVSEAEKRRLHIVWS